MTIYLAMALAYDATLVVVCLYAFLRGGRSERIGAAVNFLASVLSSLARLTGVASWAPAELVVLSIDIIVALCFYRLAVTTTRFWPIWEFGFALADIFVTLAGALLPGVPLLAYETGLGVYAYLALFALATGSARLSRQADNGPHTGARPSWPPPITESGSISGSNSQER
jgi:hypothetical protein